MAKKEKVKKKKKGCCGCFLVTVCVVLVLGVAGLFVADSFAKQEFGVGVWQAFGLLGDVGFVNQKKIVTEGEATTKDRDAFYEEVSKAAFLNPEAVGDVVDTAIDVMVIPSVKDALTQEGDSQPRLAAKSEFDWMAYFGELVEQGLVDVDKIQAFFDEPVLDEQTYTEYFVLEIKGKGLVATMDYALKRTMNAIDELKPYAGKFGVRQLKFSQTETGKRINVVLSVNLRDVVKAFLESEQFDEATDGQLKDYKKLISAAAFIVPKSIFASVDIDLAETATAKIRINNMTNDEVKTWLDFYKRMSGDDLQEQLNRAVNDAYQSIQSSASAYVDLKSAIGNGTLNVDLYDIGAKALNESLKLEGDDRLDKMQAATTVASALYANMDVNGSNMAETIAAQAPVFAVPDWQRQAQEDFLAWLKTNVAFRDGKTIDQLIAQFVGDEGNTDKDVDVVELLAFLDAEYLSKGLAFLKNDLTVDLRYLAYVVESARKTLADGTGEYAGFAAAASLQYVNLTTSADDGVTHNLLSLAISADTGSVLGALDNKDLSAALPAVEAILGDTLFLTATVDLCADKTARKATALSVNGLSEAQTSNLLTTVGKVAKKDFFEEFVESNVDKLADGLNWFNDKYFTVSFGSSTSASAGSILLPSGADMLAAVLKDKKGIELNGDELIDAADALLTSQAYADTYVNHLSDSALALAGNANAYADYDALVKKELYEAFLLSTDASVSQLLIDVKSMSDNPDKAFDLLCGTDEKDGYVKLSAAYFADKNAVADTRPLLDGHTLAYVLDQGKETLPTLYPEDSLDILELVQIADVTIESNRIQIIARTTAGKLIDEYAPKDMQDYLPFLKSVLGVSEEQDKTVSVAIGITLSGDEVITLSLQSMSKQEVDTLLKVFKSFGISALDFADESNEFRKLGLKLRKYLNDYASVEADNLISLPSLFTLANDFAVKKESVNDETLFAAVKALATSKADETTYADALTQANAAYGVSGKTYEQLVDEQIESKYPFAEGKGLDELIEVIDSANEDDIFGEQGLLATDRVSMQSYFALVESASAAVPYVEAHTLAYVFDTNKSNLTTLMGSVDEQTQDMIEMISVSDLTATADSFTVRVLADTKEVVSLVAPDFKNKADSLLRLFDDMSKLSLSLTKRFDGTGSTVVSVNGMDSEQMNAINTLLSAFEVTLLDTAKEGNLLESVASSIGTVLQDYLPYDAGKGMFALPSAFGFMADNVDFGTGESALTEDEIYKMMRALVTYDDSDTAHLTEAEKTEQENAFMTTMRTSFMVREEYDGSPVTYERLLRSFGFAKVGGDDSIAAKDLIDKDKFTQTALTSPDLLDERIVITEDMSSALFEDIAHYDGFDFERLHVPEDDAASIIVGVPIASYIEGIDPFIKDLMPTKLRVSMTVHLKDANPLYDYAILNLYGDQGKTDRQKTDDLFALFHKVGIHLEVEQLQEHANTVKDSFGEVFEPFDGYEALGSSTVVAAHLQKGATEAETGIVLPSVKQYVIKHAPEWFAVI